MCLNPVEARPGLLVACRECWQCRDVYVSDWVGRCIAEKEDATECHMVTLTYGGGDTADALILNYQHVRDYIRRIRRKGYPLRYFAVGEFGSVKNRAHWHLILFYQEQVPPFKLDWSENQPFWDHGYSHYTKADHKAIRYVMKYITKDLLTDVNARSEFGMSSHPLLGYRYFRRLAEQYVDAGLAPQDKYYFFPEVHDSSGKIKNFHMSRNVWLYFAQSYTELWFAKHGKKHRPTSPVMDEYDDLIASQQAPPDPLLQRSYRRPGAYPWLCPRTGRVYADDENRDHHHIGWNEALRVFQYPAQNELGLAPLFWSFDDRGEPAWRNEIRTATWAERRREALERRKASGLSYNDESRGS